MKKKIAMEIYDFLEAVDERNRASELALRYAVLILEDFMELSVEGRKLMADTLMELISGTRKKSDVKTYNLKGGKT